MAAIAAAAACGAALLVAAGPGKSDFALGRNMEILVNMLRDLDTFYVDEVNPDTLVMDAAYGMTARLDPYTEYIPAEAMQDFEFLTTGKYGGIGALIRQKGDYVVVAEPYEGFPADEAGLRIGDLIMAVDGEDARGFSTADVSRRLKGDPGTRVRLAVKRFYTGEVDTVEIERRRIAISGVPYHGFVSDSIGYIQHSDFTEDCSEDMLKAFMELRATGRLKGLVLDYRNNGGGILQEAVKILSMFVPKGTEVVSMRGRQHSVDKNFVTEREPVDVELPIVVLTNSNSASAAEIVSGALQDLDRAVLIGQRTYGKGLVQNTRPLGYNAFLKLTTAKYYMPSGRCIQAIDYARRNEDGSVKFVPDSLTREFSTRNGRRVFDGGGITPDLKLDPEYSSRFAMVVYGRGYIDDFVDGYVLRHPDRAVSDPADFSLADGEYGEFMEFMEGKDVEFESETKRTLAKLRERAERELYMDSTMDVRLREIERSLNDDKRGNLLRYKDELSEIIEDNIILRSAYSRGVTARRLKSDPEVLKAVEVLRDGEAYARLLLPEAQGGSSEAGKR